MTCHVATRTGRIAGDMRKAGRCANSPGHGRTPTEGSTMAEYTCVQCGETRKAPPSTAAKRLYCSWECRTASGQQHLQSKAMAVEYANCAACGRLICRQAKRVGRYGNTYCDMACRNAGYGDGSRRSVDRVLVVCQRDGCERTRLVYPSQIKNGRGRFCSRACNALASNPATTSKISTDAINDWASTEAVIWAQEYIYGPFAIDLALPLEMIAVELDGEFWHSLDYVRRADKRKDAYLTKAGWTLVRVPMLKKDTPEMVSEKIIAAVKKARRQRRREARKGA